MEILTQTELLRQLKTEQQRRNHRLAVALGLASQ
jgi:hypothetical protein